MGGKSSNEQPGPYNGPTPGFYQPPAPQQFQFPEMPSFHPASQANYAEDLAAAEADRAKTQGLNDRDALYSDYMSAAGSATDYINNQVNQERANANLMGIDYKITDDIKSTRISDYFASIWGEGDQTRLEGLIGKWGNPEGFDGYAIARGDGSAYAGKSTEEKSKSTTKGQRPTIASPTDESKKLDTTSILGA